MVHQDFVYVVSGKCPSVLGKNFLKPFKLVLQCERNETAPIRVTSGKENATADILNEFPKLTEESLGKYPDSDHRIRLQDINVHPTAARLRPVPIARRQATDEEITNMETAGIWEKVETSEWVHPLVTVPKPNDKVRVTTDLTALNKYVIPDRYPLPNIKDLLLEISGARVFSKIDLTKAYYHVGLAEESRPLTSTLTPKGLYQYRRLPMGLKDSAAAFQRRVAQTLHDCSGTIVYIDDILVFGRTKMEHDERLRKVLQRLEEKDFRVNKGKCLFGVEEVNFLGHQLSVDGVSPDYKNVSAIEKEKYRRMSRK